MSAKHEGQEALFNADTTKPAYCSTCQTSRRNLCGHDADVAKNLIPVWATRPSTCLNRHDPNLANLPEDF
jgi:hypothetical protein